MLKPLYNGAYTIKNFFSLAHNIQNFPNNDYVMTSFDVVSLFTNILVEDSFKNIEDKLYGEGFSEYNGFTKKNFLNVCTIYVAKITCSYLITNCTSKSMALLWEGVFRLHWQKFSWDITSLFG